MTRLIVQALRGQGQRYGAVDAVCFEGKCCSRAKLIGRRSLDQRSSLAGATNRRRHLDAAFSPVNMKPSLACLFRDFLAPADDEMSIRLFKRAVLNRVGGQLVQSHRKRLDCAGRQPNAVRSVERDPSTVSPIYSLRD
jgi:hypothetical protein